MSSPPKVFPEFFKVYLPELSWDRMQIPTAFVKHFNGFVPEKAILRDSVGRVWHVEGEEDVEEIERNEEQEEEEEEEEEPQSKSSNKGVVVFKRKYSGRGPRSIGRKCYYQLCSSFLSLRFFHFFFACVGTNKLPLKKTRSAYKETSRTKSKNEKACTGNVEVDNALDFKSIVKPENPCFITKIRPGRRSKLGRVSGVDDALLAEAAAFTSRPDSFLGEEISAEGGLCKGPLGEGN
ncbi:hypothetical protein CK203_020683 [Vitis vinifera]|uniref:Uncharacterized protein n=1 Tax=Vitis vinifera TaxID=29760 RepID=A0A438FMA5_VITVI|nr:hypothetical protein CK203_020683 [Vitis vinifera]